MKMILTNRLFLVVMFLLGGALEVFAQGISGQITDRNNVPLPGANVVEKGTTNGTITDVNGKYNLVLTTENPTIKVSYIGYMDVEVAITNGQTLYNVSIEEDLESLEEVVVIGYGTQKKQNVSGAITTVDTKAIEGRPVADFQSALQGQIAGLQVTGSSGQPGADNTIRIRGTATITGNSDPLYVVDGVILADGSAFSTINPSDIESVNVLKDASAAAIYGARAANGVIIVTTKRGTQGAPRFSFHTYAGVRNITKKLDMLNAKEYQEVMNNVKDNSGLPRIQNLDGKTVTTDTDWQDEIFQQGTQQSYELSGTVGNDHGAIYASLSHYDEKGILANTGFKRTTLRVNGDMHTEKFKLGSSLTYSNSQFDLAMPGNRGAVFWALGYSPAVEPLNSDHIGGYNGLTAADGDKNMHQPLAILNLMDRTRTINRILGSAFAEYQVVDGLTLKTSVSGDVSSIHGRTFMPEFQVTNDGEPPYLYSNGAELSESRNEKIMVQWENTVNYKKTIGNHNFGVLAGYTVTQSSNNSMSVAVQGGNLSNTLSILNGSTEIKQNPKSPLTERRIESYIGRVIYDYADKYLFTFNFRRDGSSRFSTGHRYGNFMSGSLGWVVSNEEFMKGGFFDNLKVRASYGALGNDAVAANATRSVLNSVPTYVFNGTELTTTVAPGGQLPNMALGWEKQEQLNIGIDGAILDNKLTFTADYFVKTSDDLLLKYTLPSSTGYNQVYINAAEVQNKGWEFTVNYNNKIGELTYNVGFNATLLDNEVTRLMDGLPFIPEETIRAHYGTSRTRIEAGHSLFGLYGYVVEGIYQSQSEIDAGPTPLVGSETLPGDLKYKDINGDGAITEDDRTFIGDANQDVMYGFNLGLGYKGFDFSLQFQGVAGNEVFNTTKFYTQSYHRDFNMTKDVLNAWTPENPSTTMPRAVASTKSNNDQVSSYWVEDASYLRLKNIQLGYSLPENTLKSLGGLSKLRVYVAAQNLLTFTDYSGYDPEVSTAGISAGNINGETPTPAGIQSENVYPQTTSMVAGVQIGF